MHRKESFPKIIKATEQTEPVNGHAPANPHVNKTFTALGQRKKSINLNMEGPMTIGCFRDSSARIIIPMPVGNNKQVTQQVLITKGFYPWVKLWLTLVKAAIALMYDKGQWTGGLPKTHTTDQSVEMSQSGSSSNFWATWERKLKKTIWSR